MFLKFTLRLIFVFTLVLSGVEVFADENELGVMEAQDLIRTINDKDEFHREITDITIGHPWINGMTTEMLRFYTAVAIVQSKNCFVDNDPTGCELFLESLKSPMGHIGFMSFMGAAHYSTEAALFITSGKLPRYVAGNIGLMVGMLVQNVLIDFANSEEMTELLNLSSSKIYTTTEERKKRSDDLWNLLWNKTFSNPRWVTRLKAEGFSLLAAAGANSLTQFFIRGTGQLANLATTSIMNSNKVQMGYRLGKSLRIGGTILRSINPFGLTITGTIMFLEWAGLTEKLIAHPIRYNAAKTERIKAQYELKKAIEKGEDLKKYFKQVTNSFAYERSINMEEALQVYGGFKSTLDQMSKEVSKVTNYNSWLANGMNEVAFKENKDQWHDEEWYKTLYSTERSVDAFFCGSEPKDSLALKKDYHGLPILFKEYPVTEDMINLLADEYTSNDAADINLRGLVVFPYKAIKLDGLCDEDILKLNTGISEVSRNNYDEEVICPVAPVGDYTYEFSEHSTNLQFCTIYQHHMRMQVLKTGFYKGKNIRKLLQIRHRQSLAKFMRLYTMFKLAYIKRYEKRALVPILESLMGEKVEQLNYQIDNGSGILSNIAYNGGVKCYNKMVIIENGSSENFVWQIDSSNPYPEDNEYINSYVCEGSIPSLIQEAEFLKEIEKDSENMSHLNKQYLSEAKKTVEDQYRFAMDLRRHFETQISERNRASEFKLFIEEVDWSQYAQIYSDFIIK